ncbi:hypothetical protein [Roseomonas sp. HF4]|uniref:hypothetical protein n=1 Tax=Roseomonas sp. HF4 TaxID=2562313 RepID=UPI0010C0A3DA|nr:hypothetical protein [Roseomonas sp. HF4]
MAPPRPPSDREKEAEARRLAAKIEALPAEIEQRARELASACRATSDDVVELNKRLANGATPVSPAASTRRGIEIVLGVDFGTSSTKIAARLPYEAGSPVYAVPVPPFAQAEEHPYLWASRLWLASDGPFSLSPLPGAAVSCALKAGLMSNPPAPVMGTVAARANAEEAACAFLALQVRQARGWLATERAMLMQRGRITWSYNFGFPAASLNNGGLRNRYQRCIAAALSLADQPVAVTLAATRAALAAVVGSETEQLERAQAALVPEIAAAVSGFANSTMLDDGLYAIVDVGGGTVDCCTFNLFKGRDGAARCPIFAAEVAMLGAEVWQGCADDPTLANYFRWDLDRRQRSVIWGTKRNRDPKSERWVQGLPVFFVGGGIRSAVHQASTGSLDAWLRRHSQDGGGVRLMRLPPPENLDHALCNATEVHRLAVAVGLSLPAVDMPEVALPDEIEDVERRRRRDDDGRFVGKEQA